MKRLLQSVWLFAGCGVILLLQTACPKPYHPETPLTVYRPLMMDKNELATSVAFQNARGMHNIGKIAYKDGYIFITQVYEGVHVVDNRNPANPVNIGFIRIPGCNDVSIKGQYLYADNATDLVTIDLTDAANPHVISRLADAFHEPFPPDLGRLPEQYTPENRKDNLVIVGWVRK